MKLLSPLMLVLGLALGLAVAATSELNRADTVPQEVKEDACYMAAIADLQRATDINLKDDQEFYLQSAGAYERLSGMGADC